MTTTNTPNATHEDEPNATTGARLGEQIASLAAEAAVREHALIRAIGEFEDSGQWAREGAISCAQWLSWRIGMSAPASRERVRVAKSLAGLPAIDAAFSKAQLSYSKVRALTRVATPDNEAQLVEIGRAATATQCERICRTFRKVMDSEDGAAAEAARRVSVREGDDGTVRVSLVLPADEGARFIAGMDSAKEMLDREQARPSEGERPARHGRADGLMAMVEGWFSTEPRPRRGGAPNEVVLHVTPEMLRATPPETKADVSAEAQRSQVTAGVAPRKPRDETRGSADQLRGLTVAPPSPGSDPARASAEAPAPFGRGDRGASAETPAFVTDRADKGHARGASAEASAGRVSVSVESGQPGGPSTADACGCGAPARVSAEARDGFAYLDNLGGAGVSGATARRLACDASLVPVVQRASGEVLDVGRKRRTVPPAIARALEARDGRVCSFPGCAHTLFLDHHHVEHWADGGETKIENLTLLCRHHHTFVHEHRWTVEMTPDGPTFSRPDGRRVEAAPRLDPLDLVALQDALPGDADRAAICATGGWEPVDYAEIIDTLVATTCPG